MYNRPKLSVVIPNRNHGCYLAACIRSVIAEAISTEIIVIDDNSSDNSIEVIESIQGEGISVKLIRRQHSRGVVVGMNEGIQLATGTYIQFRAADDLSISSAVARAISLLEECPAAGLACGDIGYFYRNPEQPTIERLFDDRFSSYVSPDDLIDKIGTNPIFSHSVIFRKSAILKAGPFIKNHRYYSDWYITHVVAFTSGIIYLPESMSIARLSATSYGNSGSKDASVRSATVRCLMESISSLPDTIRRRIECANISGFFTGSSSFDCTEHSKETGMHGVIYRKLNKYKAILRDAALMGPVYFYGAGTHSSILLSQWEDLGFARPEKIWVSDPPPSGAVSWNGIPVEVIDSGTSANHPNLVVVSSKSYEPEMYQRALDLGIGKVLTFWGCPSIGFN